MPSAVDRLKRRPDFLRVARAGRRWATPGLVLQACPRHVPRSTATATAAAIRFGITASRKVGKAVARNRARRRLRALATTYLPQWGRPGFDYVLIARAATISRPHAKLVDDLRGALDRLTPPANRDAARRAAS
jgi:ribonuclease P protein component